MAYVPVGERLMGQRLASSKTPIKHQQYVPLRDGQQLFVRSVGRGQPVVLLHGFAMNASHWLPFALPNVQRYQFILPDLRGFGRSHCVPFNSDDILTNYVDDFHDVLDHFGLDKVILGGVSMGAYTALQLNRMGGFGRVSRYVNIDQCACARNEGDWQHGLFGPHQAREFDRFRTLLEEARQYHGIAYWALPPQFREKMVGNLIDFFCFAFSRPYQHLLARQLARHFERLLTLGFLPVHNWPAYLKVMQAFMHQDYDMRASMASISVPTTFMVGMRSAMYPAAGQLQMHDYVPHAQVVKFHKSGHVPLIDEPIKFHRELQRFLKA